MKPDIARCMGLCFDIFVMALYIDEHVVLIRIGLACYLIYPTTECSLHVLCHDGASDVILFLGSKDRSKDTIPGWAVETRC